MQSRVKCRKLAQRAGSVDEALRGGTGSGLSINSGTKTTMWKKKTVDLCAGGLGGGACKKPPGPITCMGIAGPGKKGNDTRRRELEVEGDTRKRQLVELPSRLRDWERGIERKSF